MKNIFTLTQLIDLRGVLTSFFFLFFGLAALAQGDLYEVRNSTISIQSAGKLKNWKPVVDKCTFKGKFLVNNNNLESVSDFGYNVIIAQPETKISKIIAIINKSNFNLSKSELAFNQENIMILPVMKMAFFTMDVKMQNGSHFSPLSLTYELADDQSISVKGTQTIWMYQFGVVPNDIKECHAGDKVTLEMKFSLIKSQNLIASTNSDKI